MKPETIAVTGACGYLGGHFMRMAAAKTTTATHWNMLDNLTSGRVQALMDLPAGPHYRFIEGDILSSVAVRSLLMEAEVLVHCAALVRTPFAFDQPASIAQVNQWGTVRLLELCREVRVRRFIYVSSLSVYGPGEGFDEGADCRPIGPYSCSKREAELAVLAANSQELETVVLRVATLYGGQPDLVRFEAVPNRFVYLAGTGRRLTIFGSGQQRRPLVHVRDAARALLWALREPGIGGEVFNVLEACPPIGEVARQVAELCQTAPLHFTDQDYREQLSLSVSGAKLATAGWRPQEDLAEGLKELLAHFKGLQPVLASEPYL